MGYLLDTPLTDDKLSPISKAAKEIVRQQLAKLAWNWFYANQDVTIHKISMFRGLYKHSIKVKDLRYLFVLLFNEPDALPS